MTKRPSPGRRATAPRSGEASARPAGGGARREAAAPLPPDLVLLGEFGRPHGLRGEVRVKSYTADPAGIAGYKPLIAGDGRRLTILSARQAPGGAPDILVARVEGVDTREAADILNRVRLHVERDRLQPAQDEDEFLLADLIGLPAVAPDGGPVGTIVDVPNYGGGDLLEIRPASGGPSALLPFTRAFVPEVDVPGRRVVVDPPADLFAPPKASPDADEASAAGPDQAGDGA